MGCSGGLAEYQHAVLAFTGNEFLGNQVHAVAQRRDESHVGNLIQGSHVLEWHGYVRVIDRLPIVSTVRFIDIINEGLQFFRQVPVGRNAGAGGSCHHTEDYLAPEAWFQFQERTVCFQALDQSFARIKPVDGHDDPQLFIAPPVPADSPFNRLGFSGRGVFFIIDAHRKVADLDRMVAEGNHIAFSVGQSYGLAVLQEVRDVI